MIKKLTRRNVYIALLCSILCGILLVACGNPPPKVYTVGLINILPVLEETVQGFKSEMADLGYIEGENITYLGGAITLEELDSVLQDMVKADVDLILTTTTASTQAAQKATSGATIPVVFTPLADPVGAGIVESLRAPGGNSTGLTFSDQEAMRLELFMQIAPTMQRLYIPYNPGDPAPSRALAIIREVAPKLDVELILQEVHTADEAEAAVKSIPEDADGVFLLVDTLIGSYILDLTETAIEQRLPMASANADAIKQGALMGYGPRQEASGRQAARLADQILKGAKPSDLPVETAEVYLGINLQTAQAIGLEVPELILRRADTIIR